MKIKETDVHVKQLKDTMQMQSAKARMSSGKGGKRTVRFKSFKRCIDQMQHVDLYGIFDPNELIIKRHLRDGKSEPRLNINIMEFLLIFIGGWQYYGFAKLKNISLALGEKKQP